MKKMFEPRLTQKDINLIADKMSGTEIIHYKYKYELEFILFFFC